MNALLNVETARPRLGFLGIGWIGYQRMMALSRSGLATVSAIADPSADAIHRAQTEIDAVVGVSGLEGLLDCDLDGVVIATPSAAHASQAMRALERGLAVFCQKPLGCTAHEVRSVLAAARRFDRLVGVDFCYRHVAGVPLLRELVRQGELGEIHSVDLTFHNAYGPDRSWYYDLSLSGGGCLMDLGIHLIDLVMWILDAPTTTHVQSHLYAQGRRIKKPVQQLEDCAIAQLTLANGATVRLSCSWRSHAGCDAVIEAAFYGSAGGAALRNVNGSFYDFVVERFRGTAREQLACPPDHWGGRTLMQWAEKLSVCRGYDPESDTLADVAAIVDRLYGRTTD